MQENGRIIQRLHRLYGKEPFKRDVFGKRKAMTREIEAQINPKMKHIDSYLPSEEDVQRKKD